MTGEPTFFSLNETDIPAKKMVISDAFDSMQEGNRWYRATLIAEPAAVTLYFYAADDASNPPSALQNADWGPGWRNPADVLLYAYVGRYLWVKIVFDDMPPETFRLRLYYPAFSFIRYLPEIYRDSEPEDGFLTRFIALFTSLYMDMEEKISRIPEMLEPLSPDYQTIARLASWLDCDEIRQLPEDKKHSFLLKCIQFYKSAGTKAGIEAFFEWLCGEKPIILEYFQFEDFIDQPAIVQHYGNNPYFFTMLFRKEITNNAMQIMQSRLKPAYTDCQAIVLNNECRLNRHTYLGVNSYI